MNQPAVQLLSLDHDLTCTELLGMGQRELTALFRAVKELFGPEQAELSAEDWLHEVETSRTLPASAREWRLVTAKVISHLADQCGHLHAISASVQFQTPSY